MKNLSDFKGQHGIEVAAEVLEHIMVMLGNAKNHPTDAEKQAQKPAEMFCRFCRNSPEEMHKIFAILSETDPAEYTCDGSEAMINMLTLANDPIMISLFLSQSRTGDATSSGSASAKAN